MKARMILFALVVILCTGAACGTVPEDDAGDAAFVHQAIQTLLGRRPRGSAEVQALVNLLATHERAELVDALMAEPEFLDYWTLALADSMQIQRSGDFGQLEACVRSPLALSPGVPEDPACGTRAERLADFIRDHRPGHNDFDKDCDGVADTFNLNDALRAAILVDDLHVAWRPWLVALPSPHQGAGVAELRENFMSTAFDVRADCVACHSASFSWTEVYANYNVLNPNDWDRASTLGFALEVGAFGSNHGVQDDGTARYDCYQDACSGCHGQYGKQSPPGADPKKLSRRVPLLDNDAIEAVITQGASTGLMAPRNLLAYASCQSMCNDCATDNAKAAAQVANFLREQLGGYQDLNRYLHADQFDIDPIDPAGHGPWNLDASCGFAWNHVTTPQSRGFTFAGVSRAEADLQDIVASLKDGLAAFPALSDIQANLDLSADQALPELANPDAAVAMLVVANIADDLLEEVSGYRATLPHGQQRNGEQSYLRTQIMDWLVVHDATRTRISLKNALKQMVLSVGYNRRSPAESLVAESYPLPVALNPWALTEAGAPAADDGEDANGQGDLVHRRSPNQLLFSVSKDLGWPAPSIYPRNSDAFANKKLSRQIGRYESSRRPGSLTWQLDSLLFWEQKVASCQNPGATQDYIDEMLDKLYSAAGVAAQVAFSDVLLVLRDRLLQAPELSILGDGSSEADALEDLIDVKIGAAAGLSTVASDHARADVEGLLRSYCEALLMSPDYVMAGVPTITQTYAPLPVPVCLAGEPCGVTAIQDHYEETLCALGFPNDC